MNRPPSSFSMLLSRHTRRRDFIAALGGAAAIWPMAATRAAARENSTHWCSLPRYACLLFDAREGIPGGASGPWLCGGTDYCD